MPDIDAAGTTEQTPAHGNQSVHGIAQFRREASTTKGNGEYVETQEPLQFHSDVGPPPPCQSRVKRIVVERQGPGLMLLQERHHRTSTAAQQGTIGVESKSYFWYWLLGGRRQSTEYPNWF